MRNDWQAAWIWHPEERPAGNRYLYARREAALAQVPARARARVTACTMYRLFVNGRCVARGPNPSDPSRWYYDELDVAPFLRPGRNVVALIIHHCFDVSPAIIGQNGGRGGILFQLDDEAGRAIAASDASWRIIDAPPWDQSASMNCTLLGDFKEVYDARREIAGWMEAGFDDAGWPQARELGRPPCAPWTNLVPREIPFLGGEAVDPVEVYLEHASVTYAWRDDWPVYHEHRLVPGAGAAPGKFTEITRTHADFTPSILLDYGRLVTGYPEIRIHDCRGGIVDVCYGESLNLVRVDRFTLRPGAQVLAPFNRRTFRYLKLVFPEAPPRIELDAVTMRLDTYPVEPRGAFACSDELLERIWSTAAYTQRLSMLDHFVDCPWRERTIYGGDIYVENLFAGYAFGDRALARKTLRQMFWLQHDTGAIPPYGPCRHDAAGFYAPWAAYTGLALLDDWWLSGDRGFLDECWPNLARLCAWTLAEMAANEPPLVGSPAEGGDYRRWQAGRKVAFAPWETIPFAALLARAAAVAAQTGRGDEALRWGDAAGRYGDAVRAHLLGEDALAGPHPRPAGHRSRQYDVALQLWAGLGDAHRARDQAAALLAPTMAPIETGFEGFFLLEGLYGHDAGDAALAFLRRYWGEMLRRGATTFWEFFRLDRPPGRTFDRGCSACHGWSAGPVYALPARVVGLRPLEPGFARILVEPELGDLAWAEATVPTPHGDLRARWTRSGERLRGELALPRPARVRLPASDARTWTVLVDRAPVAATLERGRWAFDVAPGERVVELRPPA